jgi:hypothetical protein
VEINKKQGLYTDWIDGSSDILIWNALADELDNLFRKVGNNPWLIIVDEFHMMSHDQKTQLMRWVASHQRQVYPHNTSHQKKERKTL